MFYYLVQNLKLTKSIALGILTTVFKCFNNQSSLSTRDTGTPFGINKYTFDASVTLINLVDVLRNIVIVDS